jgi:hypothetical protein
MTDRIPLDHLTSDQLDALYDQLDTLRAVARGYCPACGRGDATPPVEAYEEQRARTARAETAIVRVRALRDKWLLMTLEPGQVRRLLDGITTALDGEQPAPDPAATQATEPAVIVGCSARTFRKDHAPHNWEPQPGMDPVHCPGHWIEVDPRA